MRTGDPWERRRRLVSGAISGVIAVIATGMSAIALTQAAVPPELPGWNLAWHDEFNDDSLNRESWSAEVFSGYGDGNGELACLTDRPENLEVRGGYLTLRAQREESPLLCGADKRFPDGRNYSSAHIHSRDKVTFEYGRFEIRAKTPVAQGTSKGLWPAFWMRPTDGDIGEIDVFESLGSGLHDERSAPVAQQSIHYDYSETHPMQKSVSELSSGNFADGFHDYVVEWEPGVIRWFVDGAQVYDRTAETTPWLDEAFSGQFFLRINLAVGGDWPGDPDSNTVFPAEYQIDYVRVYQR